MEELNQLENEYLEEIKPLLEEIEKEPETREVYEWRNLRKIDDQQIDQQVEYYNRKSQYTNDAKGELLQKIDETSEPAERRPLIEELNRMNEEEKEALKKQAEEKKKEFMASYMEKANAEIEKRQQKIEEIKEKGQKAVDEKNNYLTIKKMVNPKDKVYTVAEEEANKKQRSIRNYIRKAKKLYKEIDMYKKAIENFEKQYKQPELEEAARKAAEEEAARIAAEEEAARKEAEEEAARKEAEEEAARIAAEEEAARKAAEEEAARKAAEEKERLIGEIESEFQRIEEGYEGLRIQPYFKEKESILNLANCEPSGIRKGILNELKIMELNDFYKDYLSKVEQISKIEDESEFLKGIESSQAIPDKYRDMFKSPNGRQYIEKYKLELEKLIGEVEERKQELQQPPQQPPQAISTERAELINELKSEFERIEKGYERLLTGEYRNERDNLLKGAEGRLAIATVQYQLDGLKSMELNDIYNNHLEQLEQISNAQTDMEYSKLLRYSVASPKLRANFELSNPDGRENLEKYKNEMKKIIEKVEQRKQELTQPAQQSGQQSAQQSPQEPIDYRIIIGRNAKVAIGKWSKQVDKSVVKEGINLTEDQVMEILKDNDVVGMDEKLIRQAINDKVIDSVVVNVINEFATNKEDKVKAKAMLEQYCKKCLHSKIKDELTVKYDQSDLTKTSILGLIFGKEVNQAEKNRILNRARLAERHEVGKVIGEHKPTLRSRLVSSIFGVEIKKLATMDQMHAAAIAYNKSRDNEEFYNKVKLTDAQKEAIEELKAKKARGELQPEDKEQIQVYRDLNNAIKQIKEEMQETVDNLDHGAYQEYSSLKREDKRNRQNGGEAR